MQNVEANNPRNVFVTGSTGYIGRGVITRLLSRGHSVRALTRQQSIGRVPVGATPIVGDALSAESFISALRSDDMLVHLVGTPHPSPAKARDFLHIDLASINASVSAALHVGVAHIVYISVAHPAPVMQAYIDVRRQGEALIERSGLTATVIRPWYVLGPGHRWPLLLMPFYGIAKCVPAWRESAARLGLVTLEQMVAAIVYSVEHPPAKGEIEVIDVAAIRAHAIHEQ